MYLACLGRVFVYLEALCAIVLTGTVEKGEGRGGFVYVDFIGRLHFSLISRHCMRHDLIAGL